MKKSVLVLFSAMFLFSCTSDDDKNPENKSEEPGVVEIEPGNGGGVKFSEVKEVRIDAKAFNKWTYYSIEKGKVLEVDDFKNSLDWDIAFHRYDVRLNGGESGKGEGAALKLQETSLSKVTAIPEGDFVKDTEGKIVISYSTGAPTYDRQPYNQEMRWVKLIPSGSGPTYQKIPNVYMIKTASGKYAKIEFVSYLDNMGHGGLVAWKYAVVKE